MSDLKFLNIEEVEDSTRKVRIERMEEMTDDDVNSFCDWICEQAIIKGFKVRDVTEDGNKEVD